ncbi:hypothetical protein BRAO285_190031 [Bradyrhizobium sp. ORS 285]|nr:hypothetical protein BRAO285_190031 [Bradyrhizobium sp. ORS 285]
MAPSARRGASPRRMLPVSFSVMPGLVPPARPKPLRRGEGPGIHVAPRALNDVDGRDKPGHDDGEADGRKSPTVEEDDRRKAEKVATTTEAPSRSWLATTPTALVSAEIRSCLRRA